MKRILMLAMCLTMALAMMAQRVISGKVIEADSKEPLASTTVKLMKTDSSLVAGVLTQRANIS